MWWLCGCGQKFGAVWDRQGGCGELQGSQPSSRAPSFPIRTRERGAEPLSGALAEGGTRFRNLQLGGCSVTLEMGAADSTSILPCLGGTGCAGICMMAGLRCQLSCVCPARGTAPLLRASPASSPCGLLDKDGRSSQPSLQGAVVTFVLPLTAPGSSVCQAELERGELGCEWRRGGTGKVLWAFECRVGADTAQK